MPSRQARTPTAGQTVIWAEFAPGDSSAVCVFLQKSKSVIIPCAKPPEARIDPTIDRSFVLESSDWHAVLLRFRQLTRQLPRELRRCLETYWAWAADG